MNDEKRAILKAELIDTDENQVVGIFTMSNHYPVSISGQLEQVISWEGDGQPYEKEYFASVTVKWDGCSHFHFTGEDRHDGDSYYHICGVGSYISHMRMLHFAYAIMVEYVGGADILEAYEYRMLQELGLLEGFEIKYTYGEPYKN